MTESLVACPECDALHERRELAPGTKARCVRCGAVLYRRSYLALDHQLALVTAAILIYLIANSFPIVDLEIQGRSNSTTLVGSVLALWREGREIVAVLVFATTQLFPLVDLGALFALLLMIRRGRPAPAFAPILRFLQALRPWGMIEVFMLGIVVALVKLSNMAEVVPGVALWAFGLLTILLAVILSLDLRSLWRAGEHVIVRPRRRRLPPKQAAHP
ncbi:paraquat-inducible protein A [Nitrospirillum sp. BR 11164]|uniref:paraquat-inducible protein A n=1 Tax=Nitrospirillum sp. BR 11164 TaxID=3104324 RepID=UPI002AFE092C|nr:paraquat-inducible protein A [Nitrospirillum sp. BR 11164]MEA1652530.1 paraquat-inducible protein A [Nitrospirillum sp. BR 11164]